MRSLEAKELKILYIAADSSMYGANKSLLNLLSSIRISSIKYLVVTPYFGDLNKELDKLGIKNTIVEYNRACAKKNSLKSAILFFPRLLKMIYTNSIAVKRLIPLINEEQVNIIHSNSSVVSIGYTIAAKLKLKHVWHIREFITLDHELVPFIGLNKYKQKIHSSDSIIYISKSIASHFGTTKTSHIIYNAITNKSHIPEPLKKENYFLFCGSFTKNKGLHEALFAFKEYLNYNDNIKFKIAGSTSSDPEYYDYIVQLIQQLNLSRHIELLGYVNDITHLMSKSLALLVCSKNEAMGRVTAEAMLNGCPVIGYNNAGTSELIEDNITGLLYKTKEDMVNKMVFCTSGSNTSEIIKNARLFAQNNFTEEIYGRHISNVYKDLVK